jgi:hypothetical protein
VKFEKIKNSKFFQILKTKDFEALEFLEPWYLKNLESQFIKTQIIAQQ